jgi:hypothetical protein
VGRLYSEGFSAVAAGTGTGMQYYAPIVLLIDGK